MSGRARQGGAAENMLGRSREEQSRNKTSKRWCGATVASVACGQREVGRSKGRSRGGGWGRRRTCTDGIDWRRRGLVLRRRQCSYGGGAALARKSGGPEATSTSKPTCVSQRFPAVCEAHFTTNASRQGRFAIGGEHKDTILARHCSTMRVGGQC